MSLCNEPGAAITYSGTLTHHHSVCRFFQKTTPKEGKTYSVGSTPMDWQAARQYCISQGQTLASIHTPLEQQRAYEACSAVVGPMPANLGDFGNADSTPHGCWIGLADLSQEDRFVWTDGTATDFLNWSVSLTIARPTRGNPCAPVELARATARVISCLCSQIYYIWIVASLLVSAVLCWQGNRAARQLRNDRGRGTERGWGDRR